MEGVIRQLYDYDGSNLFPRTRPDAFVSCLQDSVNTGIETIGELIDSSTPGTYTIDGSVMDYEPEFIYRIPVSDVEALGNTDSSGTLKAVKLTQVSALHFNAVLSQDFTVTNGVGDATLGKTYAAGTLLETIIIDMLSGGAVPDVTRELPGAVFTILYTTDGQTYNPISNGGVINAGTTDELKIKYGFVYSDGKYSPASDYDISLFEQFNNVVVNDGYYIEDGDNSYLKAGTTPVTLKMQGANDAEPVNAQTDPVETTVYGPFLIENIQEGDKIYTVTLNYSAGQSVPYKADGTQSGQKINAGQCAPVMFTVRGVQVEVYDVISRSPLDMGGVQATGFNFNSRLHVINDYDLTHNTSTGLWSDDGLKIGLTKYFDNTAAPVDYLRHDQGGDDSSVYGPVFDVLSTGRFIPSAGYQNSVFISNNAGNVIESDTPFVVAGCNYTRPVSIKLMNGNSAVSTKTISYGNDSQSIMKKRSVVTSDLTVGYYAALEYYNNPIFDLANGVPAGNYMLKAVLPYTASSVTAKKSDNTNSSVVISAGNIEVNSSTFTIKEEIDVTPIRPRIEIIDISINGVTYQNGGTVPYGSSDANKYAEIHFRYTDGRFESANTAKYTVNEFDANNPGASNGRLLAGCEPTGNYTLYIDGVNTGQYTTAQVGINTINYPMTGITQGEKLFTVSGNHTATSVVPIKKSTRESSVTIEAGSIVTNAFKLNFAGAQAKTLRLVSNPRNGGRVRINSGTEAVEVSENIIPGTSVTVTASAASGYTFAEWTSSNTSALPGSTSNPYTFIMPNANITLTANFNTPTNDYHFVIVTTNDTDVNGTTYNTVDELFDSAHMVTTHFDIPVQASTLPNTWPDPDNMPQGFTYPYFGVGAGRKVFVIAAPAEYTRAKIYTAGMDQNAPFTVVPPAADSNGIPYTTGGSVKYRLFKCKATTPSGYRIEKLELIK